MEKVRRPRFVIVYEGKNITADISKYLLSVDYVDNTADKSDEVSFTVEDSEALWRGAWLPKKGEKFSLEIGYDTEMFNCGKFTVDEVDYSGPPDVVTIRGLAAGVNSPVRTKNSKAFEGQSLRKIAEEIAAKYGYEIVDGEEKRTNRTVSFETERQSILRIQSTVTDSSFNLVLAKSIVSSLDNLASSLRAKGKASEAAQVDGLTQFVKETTTSVAVNQFNQNTLVPRLTASIRTRVNSVLGGIYPTLIDTTSTVVTRDSALDGIQIQRVTQDRETDLEFLRRVAADYGVTFSLRDDKLIFISVYKLQNAKPVTVIDRKQLMRYSLKDKATQVYASARVSHHDIKTNTVISKDVSASDFPELENYHDDAVDVLEIRTKVENDKQAEEKAKAALHGANRQSREGSISMEGNPLLVAGNNFELTGMASMSGKYRITSSSHRISRSGYTTDCEIQKV